MLPGMAVMEWGLILLGTSVLLIRMTENFSGTLTPEIEVSRTTWRKMSLPSVTLSRYLPGPRGLRARTYRDHNYCVNSVI